MIKKLTHVSTILALVVILDALNFSHLISGEQEEFYRIILWITALSWVGAASAVHYWASSEPQPRPVGFWPSRGLHVCAGAGLLLLILTSLTVFSLLVSWMLAALMYLTGLIVLLVPLLLAATVAYTFAAQGLRLLPFVCLSLLLIPILLWLERRRLRLQHWFDAGISVFTFLVTLKILEYWLGAELGEFVGRIALCWQSYPYGLMAGTAFYARYFVSEVCTDQPLPETGGPLGD